MDKSAMLDEAGFVAQMVECGMPTAKGPDGKFTDQLTLACWLGWKIGRTLMVMEVEKEMLRRAL